MPYQISRESQLYGPYTLEDLQRYIASGNVLPTDLAKSEEMTDWLPVSQILATAAAPVAGSTIAPPQPAYVSSTYAPAGVSPYPDPPNLHWALVLLIGIFTCGVFFVIWDLIQVLWMKKVQPQTKALPYFIAYVVCSFLNAGTSIGTSAAVMQGGTPHSSPLSVLFAIATFVLVIIYRFTMRASLEQHFNGPDPVGLRLGPVMTFFFGGLYFQYHFNSINQIKQAQRYRGF
jgi:hypothetical protein